MSRLVTIARFHELPAAYSARSVLDACEIPCFLQNEQLVHLNWHWTHMVQGIKLHVLEDDFEEAQAVLADAQGISEVETPVESFWRRKILNGLLALLMMSHVIPVPFFVPYWMRHRQWLEVQKSSENGGDQND